MNAQMEMQSVEQVMCGSNVSYILREGDSFSATEYKVLQSQGGNTFIRCMKMLCNGKIQLYYLTNEWRPFASLVPSLDPERFLSIVIHLLGSILKVKNNGFLSCRNVDSSFERIYVDPVTLHVSLVYVPVNRTMHPDQTSFENEVRTGLIRLISGGANLQSPVTMQLSADLADGVLSLEDVYRRHKSGEDGRPAPRASRGGGRQGTQMYLLALRAPTRVEIPITKSEFVLGKKVGAVDGVISFNDKISRVHCRIDRQGGGYTVTDLQSANGTYVNGKRLQPQQPCGICKGDVIRMANSDFQVCMR